MYPGIDKWLRSKVLPGIRTEERCAFVGYLNERPVVTAVAKRGEDAKVCHLKISPELQNTNLGEVFFSLMGIELRASKFTPRSAHLTLPESLWETKADFFQSFGFSDAAPNAEQYRLIDLELRSQASFTAIWRSILDKMPKLANMYSLGGISLDSELLFSIQPKYSKAILSGNKTVELRRRFAKKWVNARVSIYESSPTYQIVGEAKIKAVHELNISTIWSRFGAFAGCTKQEFETYFSGQKKGFAIELADVIPFRYPISLMWLSDLLSESLTPPQSYLTLENNKKWAQAISLSAYMQGCLTGASNKAKRLINSISQLDLSPISKASGNNESIQLPLIL